MQKQDLRVIKTKKIYLINYYNFFKQMISTISPSQNYVNIVK